MIVLVNQQGPWALLPRKKVEHVTYEMEVSEKMTYSTVFVEFDR